MQRRAFLKTAASTAGALLTRDATALAAPAPPPILDAHIHLFDTARPGGVPWPKPDDQTLYRPALPSRYQDVIQGTGVVGAIAIEASPLASDNDWLLRTARSNPLLVGVVGDLLPQEPGFARELHRLKSDPLFLGIRYGNLWDRSLAADLDKPGFLDGLKTLSELQLVLDSANPDTALLCALARVANALPKLTIVIDHLPHAVPPAEPAAAQTFAQALKDLAAAPRVFSKLSEILAGNEDANAPLPAPVQARLDGIWSLFGEDRLIYGSDWPNSDHVSTYAEGLNALQRYVAERHPAAAEKVFWKNSMAAYRWRPRVPAQSALHPASQ